MSSIDTPPSFDLEPPTASEEDEQMRGRLAARLFGATEPQPQRIAHYELERRIGAGGMGVVFAARDTRLDRRIALKLLRRDRVRESDRLLSEARTLARLSHPHVVQVYEVGECESGVYVAMEIIEGHDLLRWQRVGQPGLADLLDAYIQAGLGLSAAHALGIIHFDFKAANLLRGEDGRVRVADFGLAEWIADSKVENGKVSRTRVMGTPGYMAPEIARGDPADARADQYSFCAALWEARTGRLPFEAGAGAKAHHRPSSRLSPQWLERVLLRGLADDPTARWPSMDSLIDRLHAQPIRRKRGLLTAGGVSVLTVLGLAALLMPGSVPEVCEAGHLDEVWTEARRAQLSDLADSPAARSLVAHADRFALRWRDVHERACQQPPEARVRVQACLDRRARRLDRTLAMFEQDLDLAEAYFDELLEQIDDPQRCEDEDQREPPAEVAGEVAGLRERIDAGRIELAAGHVAVAEVEARALVEATRGHEFALVEAEARNLLGLVLATEGHSRAAIDEHRAAARIAETTSDLPLLFASRVQAAGAAVDSSEPSLAREWLADAKTSLAMLGSPTELEIELLFTESRWRADPGKSQDFDEAAALVRRALALTASDDVPLRGRLNQRLANVLAEAGHHDEALAIYAELATSYRERLGDEAHVLGVTYHNIGLSEHELGRLDSAADHLEQAIVIQRATLGERSPKLGEIHLALASVELDRGHVDIALVHAERAKALIAAPEMSIELALILAMTLTAASHYDEALRLYESPTLRSLDDQGVVINRAWLLCRVAACRGIDDFGRIDELLGGDNADHARLILANRDLVEGRREQALVWIDALVERVEGQASLNEETEAEAAWLGAWALKPEQPERAKDLARKALDHYRTVPRSRPEQIAALVSILEDL